MVQTCYDTIELYFPDLHVLLIETRLGQKLTVREILQRDLSQRIAQALGDLFRQRHIGPAAEDAELVIVVHAGIV